MSTAHTPGALRARWDAGGIARGVWTVTGHPLVAEVAAQSEADYLGADQQHGAFSDDALLGILQAARAGGAAPLVRTRDRDADRIANILDLGAAGVVVPLVSTPEQAADVVRATRYPPRGRRSYGPIRAALTSGTREPERLEDVIVAVMIETGDGLEQAGAIAAVPGVDVLYVGPVDLSLTLGLPPAYSHSDPRHDEALARVLAACDDAGKVAGVHCADGEMGAQRIAQGFRMVTVANDLQLITAGVDRELRRIRP